jgi:nicotinamide-nucleotide amidase
MNAEIVTTGTELLLGELVDTNAAYIARRLRVIGLDLFYKTTVGDNEERMAMVLDQALARSDVIITTGGLGPTVDDVTREAVARATGRRLVTDEKLMAQIEARFRRLGRPMTANNRRQARIPEGAIPVENPVGTAPAFVVEDPRGIIISLPGVPREMKYLMENSVIPFLREHLGLRYVIKSKTLKTCGIGESRIDDAIADLMQGSNPTVGLSAHPGQTDVRITAKAENEEEADHLIAQVEAKIRERLGLAIYGVGRELLEEVVVDLLRRRGWTIALLETNTWGLIARRLAGVAGGRDVLRGALVVGPRPPAIPRDDRPPYDEEPDLERALTARLAIPAETVARYGVISPEVATEAAVGVRVVYGADLGLAVLGSSALEQDFFSGAAGNTHLALAQPADTVRQSLRFGGHTDLVQAWVSNMALDVVRRNLME